MASIDETAIGANKRKLDDDAVENDEPVPKKPYFEVKSALNFLDFSNDVLLNIFKYCNASDLKALAFTCTRLASVALDRSVWCTVDATSRPHGHERLQWLLDNCLHDGTRALNLRGYAHETEGCRGLSTEPRPKGEEAKRQAVDMTSRLQEVATAAHRLIREQVRAPRFQPLPEAGIAFAVTEAIDQDGNGWPDEMTKDGVDWYHRNVDEGTCMGPKFTLTVPLLKQLSDKCNLTELKLEHCNLNHITNALSNFPRGLKLLSLRGTRSFNKELRKNFMFKIQEHLPNLEDLDVSECSWVDPSSLLPLSKLEHLRRLSVADCRRFGECVAYASLSTRYGFKKLQYLDLRHSPLADSEVAAFGWLPHLEELYLSPKEQQQPPPPRPHVHHPDDPLVTMPELDEWEVSETSKFFVNASSSRHIETNSTPQKQESVSSEEKTASPEANIGDTRNANDQKIIASEAAGDRKDDGDVKNDNEVRIGDIKLVENKNALVENGSYDVTAKNCVTDTKKPTEESVSSEDNKTKDSKGPTNKAGSSVTKRNAQDCGKTNQDAAEDVLPLKKRKIDEFLNVNEGASTSKEVIGDTEVKETVKQNGSKDNAPKEEVEVASNKKDVLKEVEEDASNKKDVPKEKAEVSSNKKDIPKEVEEGKSSKKNVPKEVEEDACSKKDVTKEEAEGASSKKDVPKEETEGASSKDDVPKEVEGGASSKNDVLKEGEEGASSKDDVPNEEAEGANSKDGVPKEVDGAKKAPSYVTFKRNPPNEQDQGDDAENDDEEDNNDEEDNDSDDANDDEDDDGNYFDVEEEEVEWEEDDDLEGGQHNAEMRRILFGGGNAHDIFNINNDNHILIQLARRHPDDDDDDNDDQNDDNDQNNDNDGQNNDNGDQNNDNGNQNDGVPNVARAVMHDLDVRVRNRIMRRMMNWNQNLLNDGLRERIINVFNVARHLENASLITDTSIRKFGMSNDEDINFIEIGPHGIIGADDHPTSRPTKSKLKVLVCAGYMGITNKSLNHLVTAAPDLRSLDVRRTGVTASGVEDFKNLKPDCQVMFDP